MKAARIPGALGWMRDGPGFLHAHSLSFASTGYRGGPPIRGRPTPFRVVRRGWSGHTSRTPATWRGKTSKRRRQRSSRDPRIVRLRRTQPRRRAWTSHAWEMCRPSNGPSKKHVSALCIGSKCRSVPGASSTCWPEPPQTHIKINPAVCITIAAAAIPGPHRSTGSCLTGQYLANTATY